MKTIRLLLPFTHGVDMEALDFAVLLAKDRQATLIPLALVHVSDTQRCTGARLEHIQQAKDFLEATQHKAAKHDVSIERFEVFTSDTVQSTDVVVQQLGCDGIVLFARGSNNVLLSTDEARRLMEKIACMFYIVRLPVKRRAGWLQWLGEYLPGWITGRRSRTEEFASMQALTEPKGQLQGFVPGHTREAGPSVAETTYAGTGLIPSAPNRTVGVSAEEK